MKNKDTWFETKQTYLDNECKRGSNNEMWNHGKFVLTTRCMVRYTSNIICDNLKLINTVSPQSGKGGSGSQNETSIEEGSRLKTILFVCVATKCGDTNRTVELFDGVKHPKGHQMKKAEGC